MAGEEAEQEKLVIVGKGLEIEDGESSAEDEIRKLQTTTDASERQLKAIGELITQVLSNPVVADGVKAAGEALKLKFEREKLLVEQDHARKLKEMELQADHAKRRERLGLIFVGVSLVGLVAFAVLLMVLVRFDVLNEKTGLALGSIVAALVGGSGIRQAKH